MKVGKNKGEKEEGMLNEKVTIKKNIEKLKWTKQKIASQRKRLLFKTSTVKVAPVRGVVRVR